MPRFLFVPLIAALTLSSLGALHHEPTASVSRFEGPISGFAKVEHVGTVRWSYHFDHNALKDAKRIGRDIVALTESGNLVRFDAETLSITGHQVIPGRGTAITEGKAGTLLVSTENGQIYEVPPTTLELTPLLRANGRIVWLTLGAVAGHTDSIVAVVDSRAHVMPWPGEDFKAYERRSARIERQVANPWKVLILAGGHAKYIPFQQKSFGSPIAFALDESGLLWLGEDKGEFGGDYSYIELRTGKLRRFDTEWGVLGFIKTGDGRVLAYGGTSHIGMESGFVADVSKNPAVYLLKFRTWPETAGSQATKDVRDQAKPGATPTAEASPRGPIDFVVEQDGNGFWVLSEHDVYGCDRNFANWHKVAELGGRWISGRAYSVGNTPTIHRMLVAATQTPDLTAVSGRDGLARVLNGNVQHTMVESQIESSIIEVWPTSLGLVYLGDDNPHTGWRFEQGRWERLRFFPKEPPSDGYSVWDFAQPIMDDHGIVAYFGASVTPGERGFLKIDNDLRSTILQTWTGSSSFYGSSILTTSDRQMLEVSEKGLQRWDGKEWRPAGTYVSADSNVDRLRLMNGRTYIPLALGTASEVFLDTELGDLLRLTKSEKGFDLRRLTTSRGSAPGGIFDATVDGESSLLLATPSGLLRFNTESGKRRVVPAPSKREEFKSIVRDGAGRIWAAGDLLYVSSDEGAHWSAVQLPMLGPTYIKRVRRVSSEKIVITLYDRGVVFLDPIQH